MFCSMNLAESMMNQNHGSLDISQTWITQLPQELTVRGDLILNQHIKELPDKLVIEGNLDLRNTQVDLQNTSQLHVGGNLFTGPHTTGFKWLVEVEGDLDLRASKRLMSIDNGVLIVYGSLYLNENNKLITSIRQSIGVDGDLILKGSCVESLAHGRLIHARNLDLSYSAIKELPDDLVVYGNLNMSYTALRTYPERMVVFGDLDIRGTRLPTYQKGIVVLGNITSDKGVFIGDNQNRMLLQNNIQF